MSTLRLTELQRRVLAEVTRAERTTPTIALRAGLDLRTTREGLFALKKKGLVTMHEGKPQRWVRPSRTPSARTTPVFMTEAQMRAVLGYDCPECQGAYGEHRAGCQRDENESEWLRRQVRDRLAAITDEPLVGIREAA